MRHDYKDTTFARLPGQRRPWSLFAFGLSLPVVTVTSLLISEPNESKTPDPREPAIALVTLEAERGGPSADAERVLTGRIPERLDTVAPVPSIAGQGPADAPYDGNAQVGEPLTLVVNNGDSLDRLFRRNDLRLADLAAMAALPDVGDDLTRLRPGDEILIRHDGGRVLSLARELGPIRMLSITRADDTFEGAVVDRDVDVRTATAHGVIETSLFGAAVAAGMSDQVTMNMAGIFQWDIDFILDVRAGDQFTVIHEELWRDGRKLGDGEIVAAEFINRGESYRAARFRAPNGRSDYYTPEGRNVRKAFLRAPVSFTRVSSNFNPNRRHPVLNTIRAHRGVDYAAPAGTPIKAAGAGTIQSRGVNGGYGNTIVLQHGGNITTLYAHMSRFGKFTRGSRVEQGDIIGYVGSSGLATGPHLHYEYRISGVHRNPRTVSLPPADPVPPEYAAEFRAESAALWRVLESERQIRLADAAD